VSSSFCFKKTTSSIASFPLHRKRAREFERKMKRGTGEHPIPFPDVGRRRREKKKRREEWVK